MEGFLPTLTVVLAITIIVAAYIFYLKKSGYIDYLNDDDESILENDWFKAREEKAAQICDRYLKSCEFPK